MDKRALVPFLGVPHMIDLVRKIGVEDFIVGLSGYIEADFKRWDEFEKSPRYAAHSSVGVIELMPTSDAEQFAFKYVNGHPKNTKEGLQTVVAFGVLSDVYTGYPILLSEMTLLTALRTAATSAMVAKSLAPKGATTMALIGNGAQSEFQALGFRAVLGINRLRLFDSDKDAMLKCYNNLKDLGFDIVCCEGAEDAIRSADIVTTCTADKQYATILSDNMVGAGIHINAIGGDCPGKTEIHEDILRRSKIFVEYAPQTRIEGDIQQLDSDHPVTEMWEVLAQQKEGRTSPGQITLFDGVGFAIEDFSALRFVHEKISAGHYSENIDLLADPKDPRNLFGLVISPDDLKGGVA